MRSFPMRVVVILASALVVSGLVSSPASARAYSDSAGHRWSMQDRFAREVVRKGGQDTSAYHINHVFELQYRLRWAGDFSRPATGYFGKLTRGAVKRFQKRVGLRVTGVANHATWRELIPRTVRARGLVPKHCKGPGWNACFDRKRHQLTLWHNGRIWNAWLVRGGDRGYETRTGNFRVYWRVKDHVSTLYGTAMPYSQFFSGGQALHGSPLMVDPWVDHSHGCVNMYIKDARQLWKLTVHKRLDVTVYGAWD